MESLLTFSRTARSSTLCELIGVCAIVADVHGRRLREVQLGAATASEGVEALAVTLPNPFLEADALLQSAGCPRNPRKRVRVAGGCCFHLSF